MFMRRWIRKKDDRLSIYFVLFSIIALFAFVASSPVGLFSMDVSCKNLVTGFSYIESDKGKVILPSWICEDFLVENRGEVRVTNIESFIENKIGWHAFSGFMDQGQENTVDVLGAACCAKTKSIVPCSSLHPLYCCPVSC